MRAFFIRSSGHVRAVNRAARVYVFPKIGCRHGLPHLALYLGHICCADCAASICIGDQHIHRERDGITAITSRIDHSVQSHGEVLRVRDVSQVEDVLMRVAPNAAAPSARHRSIAWKYKREPRIGSYKPSRRKDRCHCTKSGR